MVFSVPAGVVIQNVRVDILPVSFLELNRSEPQMTILDT